MTIPASLVWSSDTQLGCFLYADYKYRQDIFPLDAASNAERMPGNPSVT
jgi:hypothetical protein